MLIHNNIILKLNNLINNNNIPNIIFYGVNGSGKKTLVYNFIRNIYNNDIELINTYTKFVNCSHLKGIKYIRENIKLYSKININANINFKIIILSNADKLTIEAQSALRRSIELFSHKTRFFIIVEDKYKLLNPILSRFHQIYVPLPFVNKKITNLNKLSISNIDIGINEYNNKNKKKLYILLNNMIIKYHDKDNIDDNSDETNKLYDIIKFVEKLYKSGFSCIDIIQYVNKKFNDDLDKYHILILYNKIKNEFRNEKLLMYFILNIIFFRFNIKIENITNI